MSRVFIENFSEFGTRAEFIKEILSNFRTFYRAKSDQSELEECVSLFEICKSEVHILLQKLNGPALNEKESEVFIAEIMTYLDMAAELESKIQHLISNKGA